jgi:hypothetical protein
LDGGEFTTIDHQEPFWKPPPYGINNRSQIVGGFDTAGFEIHGFVLNQGRYTTIDVPGASKTLALGSSSESSPRLYEDARGECHGYYLDGGDYTTIEVSGAPTQALGLNDRGEIVGTFFDLNDS